MCEYNEDDYKVKIDGIPIENYGRSTGRTVYLSSITQTHNVTQRKVADLHLCNYCNNEKKIEEQPNDNIHLSIYGKHLRILGKIPMMHINFGRDIIINYCPICGRKLGDSSGKKKEV